jgi:hypothetical protein
MVPSNEPKRKNKPGAGRPPLNGERMKEQRLTVPVNYIEYLREIGKDNISAAFRDYINWSMVWDKFREATGQDALNIGASIVYKTYEEYPPTYAFRNQEQAGWLRQVGNAITTVCEYFAQNSGATFRDRAIEKQMAIISEYDRVLATSLRNDPMEQFKAAVGIVAYALPIA